MKKTFWTALLAGALIFGMSNAFAQGVSMGKDRNTNDTQMAEAQTHTAAALEAAKVGDAPGVLEHTKAAWNSCKDVTGETVMPYYERAMEKISTAQTAVDNKEMAAAVTALEGAVKDMAEGQAAKDY